MTAPKTSTAHRDRGWRLRVLGALAGAVSVGLVATGCGQIPADQAAPAPDSQVTAPASPTSSGSPTASAEPTTAVPSPVGPSKPPTTAPTSKPAPSTVAAMLQK